MDAKKVLKDLQYRIETSDPSDPERENAIRLRDRLLSKFGMRLDEITVTRKTYSWDKCTSSDIAIMMNYFEVTFPNSRQAPYNRTVYTNKHGSTRYSVEINLTDDEAEKVKPYLDSLLLMWRRQSKAYERQLRKELESKRHAFKYAFLDKADLLVKSASDDEEEDKKPRKPKFSWSDVMRAGSELEDLVFPQNHLKQETRQITSTL
jgi:hypothetical protein